MQETIELRIVPSNPRQRILWDIALVGVGGTGGYVLQSLMRMLKAFEIEGCLTIADGDSVEMKNLQRQNFILPDVGKKKVEVLARRYANVYDMDIRMIGDYLENMDAVKRLFTLRSYDRNASNIHVVNVLIGAVDNSATRRLLHDYFMSESSLIYVDAGNDSVLPISKDVTEEDHTESGYSGQAVLGVRHNGKTVLQPVGGIYPDVLGDVKENFFPSQSCGRVVVNYPQRMQTNLMAATVVLGYLNTILADGVALTHYTNFNARNQVMRPVYLTREYLSQE